MNLLPDKIMDEMRTIASLYSEGCIDGNEDQLLFEMWIESNNCDKCGNSDTYYIKTLKRIDAEDFLKKAILLHPLHLFRIKKITWDDNEQDWDEDEPFQSAEEEFLQ